MRNKRRKKRLQYKGLILLVILLMVLVVGGVFILDNKDKDREDEREELVKEINSHYNEYVITNKETDLYDIEGNICGKINKEIELSLEEMDISSEALYFKIKDMDDLYISYKDVDIIESISNDMRYKNYIPYNKNIVTNIKTTFYDKNHEYVYTLDKSYDLVLYIQDNDWYGVEYNDRLLYIKKEDINNVYDNHNTDKTNSSGVAVLNYHFFYDNENEEDTKTCQEAICHSKVQFKSQLELIKEMNIFTVTTEELELYMDGKLQLPRSVLLTIDDGGRTSIAVDMLNEYKMNATIFLITSWFNPDDYYKNEYIELHSHTHNLHDGGKCPGGQGSGLKCLDQDVILNDLKMSREALGGSHVFCYPFYEYNDYSEKMLKEAGFTMAFIGEIPTSYGYKLANVSGDKLKIPRFVIMTHTTLQDLRDYFNEIK